MRLFDPSKLDPKEISIEVLDSYSNRVPIEGRYAIDYIERAKNIMSSPEKNGHALADAVSNCKNAIDYQMDVIFHSLGLEIKGRTNFPEKIRLINQIGVVAPSILNRINRTRNKIAHEYYLPTADEVKDAIDVAELFYYSTNRLSKLFVNSMTIYKDKEELCSITYQGKEITIEIELKKLQKYYDSDKPDIVKLFTTPEGPEKEKLRKERNEYYHKKFKNNFFVRSFNIEDNHEPFFKWLAFLVKVQS